MKVIQSYASSECNEFEVYNRKNVKLAYYIEHFKNPITNAVLPKTVFEIYFEYDAQDDEYRGSLISENFKDIVEVINSL
jgi:hypothetical protein